MLPESLAVALREQIACSRALWESDRQAQLPGVYLSFVLEAKYPHAGESWTWQCVFAFPSLSADPQTNIRRRHFLFPERLQRALKAVVALLVSPNRSAFIPCAIALRPMCFSEARTFGRFRSCWGIVM